MIEASLTASQMRLLERYSEVGGVIEYVVLEATNESMEEVHRESATTALTLIQQRSDHYAETVSREQGIPRAKIFQMTINL